MNPIEYNKRINHLKSIAGKGVRASKAYIIKTRREFELVKAFVDLRYELCYVCERAARHRHHVVPIHKGGDNLPTNIVVLCIECHDAVEGFGRRRVRPFKPRKKALSSYSGVVFVTM